MAPTQCFDHSRWLSRDVSRLVGKTRANWWKVAGWWPPSWPSWRRLDRLRRTWLHSWTQRDENVSVKYDFH